MTVPPSSLRQYVHSQPVPFSSLKKGNTQPAARQFFTQIIQNLRWVSASFESVYDLFFGVCQIARHIGDCSVLGWMKTKGTGLLSTWGNYILYS